MNNKSPNKQMKELKPVKLYHCPKCDYEAGRPYPVVAHIDKEHKNL